MKYFGKAQEKIARDIKAAMPAIAAKFRSMSINRIPVHTGKLRRSMQVVFTDDSIIARLGKDIPYAHKQYYTSLRHAGTPTRLLSLTNVVGSLPSVKDRGRKARYAAAYRIAREKKLINKLPAPKVFETVYKSKEFSDFVRRRFK